MRHVCCSDPTGRKEVIYSYCDTKTFDISGLVPSEQYTFIFSNSKANRFVSITKVADATGKISIRIQTEGVNLSEFPTQFFNEYDQVTIEGYDANGLEFAQMIVFMIPKKGGIPLTEIYYQPTGNQIGQIVTGQGGIAT